MGKFKLAIIGVCMVLLIVGFYFYLSNYSKPKSNNGDMPTAVQDILLKNLDNDYPKTPREVVRYYSEITKCLRSEKYTDEQFELMADKMRALFDSELLAVNPREVHLAELKKDVNSFVESNYTMYSYTLSSAADVEEYNKDGRKCANLYCTYSFRKGADYSATKYIFVLRIDPEDKHWKILEYEAVSE